MLSFYLPIVIIIGTNTLYNLSTKNLPENVNAFASLTVTYVISAIASYVLFLLNGKEKNIITEIGKMNIWSVVLGLAIVFLEYGFIAMYRAGWKISVGSLVANVSVAIVLLLVGYLFYHENITLKQLLGVLACAFGLYLLKG